MRKAASYSFSLNITVMKLIGFYPSDSYQSLHKAYSVTIYILAIMPAAVLGILHFVFTVDFTNFDNNGFILVSMPFYVPKFLPFLTNGKKIKSCIHYFDDWDCSVPQDEQKKIITEECVSVCRRISNVFFLSCCTGIIGFIGLLIKDNFKQLPLNVWLPEFALNSPIFYYTVYVILVFGVAYAALACGTVDPLIAGLAYHATTQLQVLKKKLQNLDLQVNDEFVLIKNMDQNTKSRKMNLAIKNCILHYQTIIEFVREYEACFSPVVFSQLVESGVTIGLLCFQISKTLVVDIKLFIMMNYLGVLFFQIFFYCYYGTLLIEESKTLSTAIYMSRWYEYSIESKRALIILMERSKRPMVVTAGKLFDLSIDTFTTILKRAYTLLAILRNY